MLIIEFWASWCIPCKVLEPIISDLEEEFKDTVTIERINIDRLPKFAEKYNIRGVPTIVFIKNDKEFNRHVGSISKDRLREMINDGLDR